MLRELTELVQLLSTFRKQFKKKTQSLDFQRTHVVLLFVPFQSTRLAQVPSPPQGGGETPDGCAADPRPGSPGLSLSVFCPPGPKHSCNLAARKPAIDETCSSFRWALLMAPSYSNAAVWLWDRAWLRAGFGARWLHICFHYIEEIWLFYVSVHIGENTDKISFLFRLGVLRQSTWNLGCSLLMKQRLLMAQLSQGEYFSGILK